MRALDLLHLRLRSLFRRSRVEAELLAELSFHLEQQTAEYVAAGMAPAEARHAAHRILGNLGKLEEECRDMRRTRWIETFLQDLRYALRSLRLSPAFTAVATLSLALGIGANTAIFTLLDALLLRELPVRAPGQLVALGDPSRVGGKSEGSIRTDLFSLPLYRELRDRNQVFSGLIASGRTGRLTVGTDRSAAKPETVRGRLVSGNYFAVLGVPAFRGRTFTGEEDRRGPGASPYVVISYDYWQRRFGADPATIGKPITLNDYPFTIIGVTPPEFFGDIVGTATEVWIPLTMQRQVNPGRDFLEHWDVSWMLLMGRLKPGVSLAQAGSSIEALFQQLITSRVVPAKVLPENRDDLHIAASPGGTGFSYLRRQFSRPLKTLMAIVGLVLLIACANVANLLLERATGRQKEISVRLALGAGRLRLVRQLLTESLVLAFLGGALGVLFAFWADAGLLKLIGAARSPALDLKPNLTILAFTAGVSLLTGVLFGLAPALRSTRVELAPALKESSRNLAGAGGGRRLPLGKVLVVSQFAVSLLLLMGAGLFVRTLANLQRLDLGYPREGLLMLNVDPVGAGYPAERLGEFIQQMIDTLRAVPGVTDATMSENGLFSGTESSTSIAISGRPPMRYPDNVVAYDRVAAGYFETVGIRLVLGRGIRTDDRVGTLPVAVINESMARFYFPRLNPVGQRFAETDAMDRVYEVVGVSRDVRDHELRGDVQRRYYTPLMQGAENTSAFNFAIRTRDPKALVEPVRDAVRAFDSRLSIDDLVPLGENIDDSIGDERLVAKLSAVFGFLALLLASIGLYGVISYAISRRTNEIGIRMALGANHGKVLWMVIRETLLLALAGIVLGLLAVLATAKAVESRLFGLSAYDPPTLASATAVLVLVAFIAGAIPGSRATRVDPTEALRYE